MKTLFSLILYLLISNLVLALTLAPNRLIDPELKEISKYPSTVSVQLSPDKKTEALLFESIKPREEGELPIQVLKITTPDKTWLIKSGDWINFTKIAFLDDQHLLLTEGSLMTEASRIINLSTQKSHYLGKGTFEILDKNLIKLYGQKHYFPAPKWGAFWVDTIVDVQGNVIEVLSPNSKYLRECVPLNLILDQDKEYPKLKQSTKDCIYVKR